MRKTTAKQSNKMSKTNNNVEITVQNAEGEPDTKATILVQNQIDYEPKVSVIIPVYNVEEYLRQCLDSVINQTLKEIEIICVDDGSTDSSLEILKEYAAKDHRITVITQQNNGAAIARNIGLYNINANYIGFIDADDYIDLDFYEKLLNMAIKTNADIVKSNAKIIDCDLTTRFDDAQISNIRLYGKWRFLYQWWTGLYKANIIKNNNIKFPDKIISSQDIVFLTYCVLYANKIELCPNTFYHYLRHPDSLDGQVLSYEKILSKISAIKIISKLYNNIKIPKDEYIYCYHQRWILLKSFLNRTNEIESKKQIVKAFIDIYTKCKYKQDLINFHIKYDPNNKRYINYILYPNIELLLKTLTSNNYQSNFETNTQYTYTLTFFNFLPLIKLYKTQDKLIIKILNLQIFKIKKNEIECFINLLHIPFLKVISK